MKILKNGLTYFVVKKFFLIPVFLFIYSIGKAQTGTLPNERLITAIATMNLNDAKDAIKDGAIVKKGTSASLLHILFANMQLGNRYSIGLELMKLLLKNGTDANELEENVTVLFLIPGSFLTEQQQVEIATLLLENGAKTEILAQKHMYPEGTILMYACLFGNDELVKLLVSKGAKANAKNDDLETPLMFTVKANADAVPVSTKVKIIQILLAKGANVNAKNDRGETVLNIANDLGMNELKDALAGKTVTVKEVKKITIKLDDGSSTDVSANAALVGASFMRSLEYVKKALDAGAEVNFVTTDKATALTSVMVPPQTENIPKGIEVANYLIQNGASVNWVDKALYAPLSAAILWYQELKSNNIGTTEILSLIQLLLEKKADVDAITTDITPVMKAAQFVDIPLLKLLLPKAKNINKTEGLEMTALNYAIGIDAYTMALVQKRDKKMPELANVPYGYGTQAERLEAVKLLLQFGANPNIKNQKGVTPLLQAKARNFTDIEAALKKAGAK